MKATKIKEEKKLIFDCVLPTSVLSCFEKSSSISRLSRSFGGVELNVSLEEFEERYKKALKEVVKLKEKVIFFRDLEDISKEDEIKYQKASQALMEAKEKADDIFECLLSDSKVIGKFKMKF